MANGGTLRRQLSHKQDELASIEGELEAIRRQLARAEEWDPAAGTLRERAAALEGQQAQTRRDLEMIRQMAASFNEPLEPSSPGPGPRTPPRQPRAGIPIPPYPEPQATPTPPASRTQPPEAEVTLPMPAVGDAHSTPASPSTRANFCGRCRTPLPAGVSFCPACGAPVASPTAYAEPPPTPATTSAPRPAFSSTPPLPRTAERPIRTSAARPTRADRPVPAGITPGPPLEQMVATLILALVGAATLVGGVFAPIMRVTVFLSFDFSLYQLGFQNGHDRFLAGCAILLGIAAVTSVVFALTRLYILLWVSGVAAAGGVVGAFVYYQVQVTNSPQFAQTLVHLMWGWLILGLGALLILASALASTLAQAQRRL